MPKPKLFELVIPCDSDESAQIHFANALHKRGLRAVDAPVVLWQKRLFSVEQDAVVRAHVQNLNIVTSAVIPMRYLRLFLVLCLALPCFAQRNPAIAKAHKTTHKTYGSTIGSGGSCSATAVGSYALLTASHCELPTDNIVVDGDPRKILRILRDGNDHTIYLLDGKAFTDVASIGYSAALEVGDAVFIFGNPGDLSDVYRSGTVARFDKPNGLEAIFGGRPAQILLNISGFFGDSGAAVFGADGAIVTVISTVNAQTRHDVSITFMGAYPLRFSAEQLSTALSFVAPTK